MSRRIRLCENRKLGQQAGFTLLEILIALFIFTIISTLLVAALHSVIGALTGAEESAERLRKMQMVLLIMSRDVEQTANRPVLDPTGNEEVAFLGTPRSFTFTHLGFANLTGATASGGMQRTQYFWDHNTLWRRTWTALDQPPQAKPHSRALLDNVVDARFQYLDSEGRFQDSWPIDGQTNQPLPRAVRVVLITAKWGRLTQLFVIPAQPSKNLQQAPPPPSSSSSSRSAHAQETESD